MEIHAQYGAVVGAMLFQNIVLFAALAAAQVPKLPVEQYQLKNGLTVLLSEDHRLPVVAVEMVYLVGSANEKPGRSGFAHLFEHLMFQGSKNYDHDYFTPFEPIGGDVNGTTSEDRTNFFERVPSNYLELPLWMQSERMENLLPALTQKRFENQRAVVKNERRQRYDNQPYGRDWEVLGHALFPKGHPYHERPIGSMKDLDAATVADAREFFKANYGPANAALIVVGDFDKPATKAEIELYFGGIPAGQRVPAPTAEPPRLKGIKHVTHTDDVNLPRIYLAWPTPALFEPGDAELDLFSSVLSTGKTSRLYQPLVYDKKVAKDVDAFQVSQKLSGYFVVEATAAPGESIDDLYTALIAELGRALSRPPTEDELTRAKNAYKKEFFHRVEAVSSRASLIGTYFLHTGKGDYIRQDLERYIRPGVQAVFQAGKKYLDLENMVRLDVLPKSASAGAKGATP